MGTKDSGSYTDHCNLIQDALGLSSNRVHRWHLLLEESVGHVLVDWNIIQNRTYKTSLLCNAFGWIPKLQSWVCSKNYCEEIKKSSVSNAFRGMYPRILPL